MVTSLTARLATMSFRAFVIVIAGLVLFLLPTWNYLRPDLLLDPLNRYVYLAPKVFSVSWESDPIDLVPAIFAVGETRAEVAERLRQAGYRRMWADEQHGIEMWQGGGGSMLFCGYYYFIRESFASSHVTAVVAMERRECL